MADDDIGVPVTGFPGSGISWRRVQKRRRPLGGKPIFRGTRITVEMVLKLMAAGWSIERMMDEYPGILPDHLRAVAAELMRDEDYVAIGQARAA